MRGSLRARGPGRRFAAVTGLAILAACSSPESPSQPAQQHTISASEATALQASMTQLASANSSMAWLTDSAALMLQAGAVAKHIIVGVDGAARDYYAVSLQRNFAAAQFSTLHVFAFDDPAEPRSFMVLSGYWSQLAGPRTELSGTYGGVNVHADFVTLSGGSVTDWRASSGTATMFNDHSDGSCTPAGLPSDATCEFNVIGVETDVTAAGPESGPQDHAAAVARVLIPGLLIAFQ